MTLTQYIRDSVTHELGLTWPLGGAAFSPDDDWALIFTAKRRATAPDASALIQKASGAGITVGGSTASVAIVPADTTGLTATETFLCDVQAQHVLTGEVRTVWVGRLQCILDITRETTTSIPVHTTEPPLPFSNIAQSTHAAASKTTPVDADEIPLADSAASWALKKLTWANLKATLKSYLDAFYQAVLVSGTNLKTINGTSLLGAGDLSVGGDVTSVAGRTGDVTLASADITDLATVDLPAVNTPLSDALDAKLDKASSITITGTTPAPTKPMIEIAPVNGKRSWNNDEGWEIYYDSVAWILSQNASVDYEAKENSTTDEPWKLTGWSVNVGTGEPTLAIDPPDISPIGATGTRALTDRQDGKVNVTSVAGTLPVANGGTGGTDASTARTNLGLGTGDSPTFAGVTASGNILLNEATRVFFGAALSSNPMLVRRGDQLLGVRLGNNTGDADFSLRNLNASGTVSAANLSLTNPLSLANGGTGGTDASTARTNLGAGTAGDAIFQAASYTGTGSVRKLMGLDTTDSPTFASVTSTNINWSVNLSGPQIFCSVKTALASTATLQWTSGNAFSTADTSLSRKTSTPGVLRLGTGAANSAGGSLELANLTASGTVEAARMKQVTSTAADPTTTEYPTSGQWGIHKNTSSGDVFLAYNDGGSIKKVQLT